MTEETIQQQVNLLDKRFREDETLLSPKRIIQAWVVVLVLMALYSAYSYYDITELEKRAAIKQDEVDNVTQVLNKLESLTPQGTIESLEQEVEELKKEKERKLLVKDILRGTELGNITGFSRHMEGLARQIIPNLWLTSISIEDGGKSLAIAGSAIEPKLVPRYLQMLSNEQSFAGSEFRTFLMGIPEQEEDASKKGQAKDKPPKALNKGLSYINFAIRTLVPEEDQDGKKTVSQLVMPGIMNR